MSNNLNLDQVAENQAAKEVTINTATGQLDAALTESYSASFSSGNVSLTDTQYRRAVRIQCSSVTASGRKLTLPALKKMVALTSDASNTQSLEIVRGTTSLFITPGSSLIVYTDGNANGLFALGDSTASVVKPYDVGTYCAGLPDNGEILLRFNYPRKVTLPTNLVGSRVTAATAATATTDFVLNKNGSSVGTIRFAASGTVATFVGFATDTTFDPNDQLSLVAPGTADATLANIAFTFAGAQG